MYGGGDLPCPKNAITHKCIAVHRCTAATKGQILLVYYVFPLDLLSVKCVFLILGKSAPHPDKIKLDLPSDIKIKLNKLKLKIN